MAKEMQVIAWDDIHLLDGEKIEAQHIDVPVQFGTLQGVLDLTDEHYDQAEADFRKLFGAVFGREARELAMAAAKLNGGGSTRRKEFQSPLDKLCPFPAGTKERRDYLTNLRNWADQAGRGAEFRPPPGSNKNDNEYHYPKALLLAYNAFLSMEAQRKAS